MKSLAVLRPEPGNAATAARIAAAGAEAVRLPLFEIVPLTWSPPPVGDHDAILLTSANAVRSAGDALRAYESLPVHAVGAATARAAVEAGLTVAATGTGDARHVAAAMVRAGVRRALHLTGRHRAMDALPGVGTAVAVYASAPLPRTPAEMRRLSGTVALIHSPRAALRLAELVADRATIALAAISATACAAAGEGWLATAVAPAPNDASLIAVALTLAD